MIFKKLFICFSVLMFFACNNNTNPYANDLGIPPEQMAEMDTAHYTTIKWQDTLNNFGVLKKGDSVHLKFQFKNVGEIPLFVFNTRTTCGCTITGFPRDAVMPGKSGVITVTFKSGSEKGEINKKIVVITNTKNGHYSNLHIRGVVEESGEKK